MSITATKKQSLHTANVARLFEILPDVIVAMILSSLRKLPEFEVKKFMAFLRRRGK